MVARSLLLVAAIAAVSRGVHAFLFAPGSGGGIYTGLSLKRAFAACAEEISLVVESVETRKVPAEDVVRALEVSGIIISSHTHCVQQPEINLVREYRSAGLNQVCSRKNQTSWW